MPADDKLRNEIAQLWKKGMSDKEIAYELEIPERLVSGVLAKRKADQLDPRNCGHKLTPEELDELTKRKTTK